MMMRKLLPSFVAISLVLVAGLAAAGDPKTALGKWMVPNMGTAFSGTDDNPDFDKLKTSITCLIKNEPPAAQYGKWDAFLQQALAAANAKDKKAMKATCKGCHDSHKAAYIADTAIPTTPPACN
jgi:cytochrome c553